MAKEKNDKVNPITWVVMLFFSWLGLAGFADNIVVWHDWFEFGFFEHWRLVRTWIIVNLLSWVPFRIPNWLLDQALIGLAYSRAVMVATTRLIIDIFKPFGVQIDWRVLPKFVIMSFLILIGGVLTGLGWPFVLLKGFLRRIGFIRFKQEDIFMRVIEPVATRMFVYSLVFFIPVLFLATDLINTFK